jgi:hypothetical protein
VLRRRPRNGHDHPAGLRLRREASALCLAVLAAGLVAGGCGGDDNGGGSSAAATKAAFIDRANNVCVRRQEQLQQDYVNAFGGNQPSNTQQIRFTTTTAIPNVEQQLRQLRRLPAPEQDRATLERYFTTYERAIADLKRDPSVVTGATVPASVKAANRLAIDYGIDRCVR